MTTIDSFVKRLAKIGITVELVGNFPWVYLDKVNGIQVKEPFQGNHGFTVFFSKVRNNGHDQITDISYIFKKIREILVKGEDKWVRDDEYSSYH